jgi:hypothetical protein
MRARRTLRNFSLALVAITTTACSGSDPSLSAKTEALAADGGDLGKAFAELGKALAAGEKSAAGKLLDPDAWHMDNKQPDFLKEIGKQISDYRVIGGKRKGDYATLFLATPQPYYAMLNAKHLASGWQFDSPLPTGTSFGAKPRDCATVKTRFPCGAVSAPDAQVSGMMLSLRAADPLAGKPKPVVLMDGIAVRMLDSESKTLKSTKLVLANKGINQTMLDLSDDPQSVEMWLGYPLLRLDVAADNKSAKGNYFDGFSHKEIEVREGFSIDPGTPNRIRGHLKTDIKDIAQIDVSFDVAAASDCIDGSYHCGEE